MEDFPPLIERAFSFTPSEESYTIENIDGDIPQFIRGTYYLNGPARFSHDGFHYNHWLDGDGMVCALRFEDGRVNFTSRFVHSAKYAAEEEARRPLFRTFGTAFECHRLKRGVMLESPVNVSVYPYAGTLLAFGEQGLPLELDPLTLETRGEFNFHGALNDISPFSAVAFRNVRLNDPGTAAEVAYERKRAQQLVLQNMMLRREADVAGDVQISSLLE